MRLPSLLPLCICLTVLSILLSTHTNVTASTSSSKYTVVADLHDGPTEYDARQHAPPAVVVDEAASETLHHDELHYRPSHLQQQRLSQDQLAVHNEAIAQARGYAMRYVKQHHATHSAQSADEPVSSSSQQTAHTQSGYERIQRRKEEEKMQRHAQEDDTTGHHTKHKKNKNVKKQHHHDEPELAFLEEQVQLSTQAPYKKQPWTYNNAKSPPKWLKPNPKAKQGVPTTKPPPVPRMPPPPAASATPSWMSPWDSDPRDTFFPDSTQPAPFYGMASPPKDAPATYLPLDTFMTPGKAK